MRTKRWLFAVNGIVALLFLGLIYAWSVFVGPLEEEFGWLRSETGMIFSISMFSFCIGGLAGGFLSKRFAARIVMCLAAVFILAGFLLSSAITTLLGLFLSYGVVCAFGVGIGYNAVLNSVMRWFPDIQGTMSGILLMGFGFGGSVLSSVAVAMMSAFGWRATFRLLGIILCVLVVLSSLLLKKPTQAQLAELGTGKGGPRIQPVEDVPTSRMVRQRTWICYFIWSMVLSAVGLALIGNAAPLAGTFTQNVVQATFVAGLLNIFNGLGRLVVGFLFDILGSRKCMYGIAAGLLLSMLILMGAVQSGSMVLLGVGFVTTGFFYGGITPSNSAYASRVFGQKYYPLNLSVTNLVLLAAAFLGPSVAGVIQTRTGNFFGVLIMLLAFCVVSIPFVLLTNKHTSPRSKQV